eukprot:CAMPEP_0197318412 /NCGR_PEP_ID=MMETSP0891-20130614/50936_1 /TAXON_ID=44058 ORGANISM="Aureoumbra lagunensis, Strain CCMP1510" /NCGR_SAMPLE_ID=MMETSP0891 /ASSEMBLY_ACC=CAM_ASM_000534 /LENGTH=504 /DNA_ID=CAMNT_0042808861 /DNA_START=872 /DNA_END=2390 /DNA_ORIENTATION=+
MAKDWFNLVKTVLSILPALQREYHSLFPCQQQNTKNNSHCFEILGFDVIIDHALRPWLVEINHLPSFGTDSDLDQNIKSRVVREALSLVQAQANDRNNYEMNEMNQIEQRLYYTTEQQDEQSSVIPPEIIQRNKIQSIRRKIQDIFLQSKPEHIVRIEGWMRKYAGREESLLQLVEKKYMPSSNDPAPVEQNIVEEEEEEENIQDDDDISDDEIQREESLLQDFERIYPIPRDSKKRHHNNPAYTELKRYVLALDNKRYCRQRASSASSLKQDTLPRVFSEYEASPNVHTNNNIFTRKGGAFYDKPKPLPERKPLPKPNPNQIKAAERLAQGFSTTRTQRSTIFNPAIYQSKQHPQSASTTFRTEQTAPQTEQKSQGDFKNQPHHIRLGQVSALQPTTFDFFHNSNHSIQEANKQKKAHFFHKHSSSRRRENTKNFHLDIHPQATPARYLPKRGISSNVPPASNNNDHLITPRLLPKLVPSSNSFDINNTILNAPPFAGRTYFC